MEPRTVRLYQRDSFLTRFRAVVVDVRPSPAGEDGAPPRFDLLLDRTAFYPEGGGQPFDTGRLAGLPVVAVREGDAGPLHTVSVEPSGPALPESGDEVEGVVDWDRRHDHMQQHSGQHLLSRAFLEVAAARTRSFHLGSEICTIDIAMSPPDEGAIGRAAELTNSIVAEDRPVAVSERDAGEIDSAEEAGLSGLKLKPGDPVRIIEVDGFDANPCGGTHVARTGQVGPVALLGHEPFRGMTRITFACGRRVARLLEESTARLN
ncbi:MAG TPA: alanyl-tRNA editing protein, partial [Candidatus Saccharimonadales bacterium]|nr:alanyl-tRNA editing protein [Candidatus Saccharimonadales bacterium]